jgi:hypothetical protein
MVVSTEGSDLRLYQETGGSYLKLVRPGDKVFSSLVACGSVRLTSESSSLLRRNWIVGANVNSLVMNAHLRKPCKKG